ncbi:hypothetical protein BKA82DRAFT_4112775, partial [Pisolithus tinctorius]
LSNNKPNPHGELCVHGPNCFMGYYKDEKTTRETLKDGWIHTGDVTEVDSSGCFKIIDQVKNIMKLVQGKYHRTCHFHYPSSQPPLPKDL